MDKVCKEFEVDFSYFVEDKQVNNIKKLDGSVNNHGTINLFPENIIDQVKLLVEENGTLKEENNAKNLKISELNKIIDNLKKRII